MNIDRSISYVSRDGKRVFSFGKIAQPARAPVKKVAPSKPRLRSPVLAKLYETFDPRTPIPERVMAKRAPRQTIDTAMIEKAVAAHVAGISKRIAALEGTPRNPRPPLAQIFPFRR